MWNITSSLDVREMQIKSTRYIDSYSLGEKLRITTPSLFEGKRTRYL